MISKKRKVVSVDEKLSLIRAIEKGEKQSHIVRRTGLSSSTVATIWKDRKKWLNAEIEEGSKKRLRKPQYENLDRAVLQWFHQQRRNNVPLSGRMVKTQASFLASELGIEDFKASEGWLGKWKRRHKLNGEAYDTNKDDNVGTTSGHLEDDLRRPNHLEKDEVEKNDTKTEPDPEPPPTHQQALDAAKILCRFFIHKNDDIAAVEYAMCLQDKLRLKNQLKDHRNADHAARKLKRRKSILDEVLPVESNCYNSHSIQTSSKGSNTNDDPALVPTSVENFGDNTSGSIVIKNEVDLGVTSTAEARLQDDHLVEAKTEITEVVIPSTTETTSSSPLLPSWTGIRSNLSRQEKKFLLKFYILTSLFF